MKVGKRDKIFPLLSFASIPDRLHCLSRRLKYLNLFTLMMIMKF